MIESDFARTSWIATMSNIRTTRASTSTTSGLASFDSPNTWILKLQMSNASGGLPAVAGGVGGGGGAGGGGTGGG